MKEQILSVLTTFFTQLNDTMKDIDSIDFFYILSLFTIAISLFAIAYIASRFLSIWNNELKQKKRLLLAQQIMEQVYNLQDILLKIRKPFYFPSEVEEIIQDIKKYHYFVFHEEKIKYLIPFYRIKKYASEFTKFKKIGYQTQFYWKDNAIFLFKKMLDITEEIENSSRILYECELPKEEKEKHIKNIWCSKESDPIKSQVQNIIKEFKINLEKIYKAERKPWKQIKVKK